MLGASCFPFGFMRHVRIRFHILGMLAILSRTRQYKFMIELAIVAQHEFDLIAFLDLYSGR